MRVNRLDEKDFCMNIKLMTWNTQLYEYGNIISKNKSVKPIDYGKCIDSINTIREHMKKENAIAILQEIPLRCNITNSEHIIWTMLCDVFPTTQYSVLYNVNESVKNQIKTTIVIAKKDFVKSDTNGINSSSEDYCNCFVSFKIPSIKLTVLAVHQSLNSGVYVSDKLNSNYSPDMIIGDFNAGNYTKTKEPEDFINNREKYRELLESGYKDICQEQATTRYNTPIDHVLIKNERINTTVGQNILYQCKCIIDDKARLSDHYPIYCTINYEEINR